MSLLSAPPIGIVDPEDEVAVPRDERIRALLSAAFTPLLAGYVVAAAVVAVVVAFAAQAGFSLGRVLAAAGAGWLVAWHVTLIIRGGNLGVLPLALTAIVVWFVWHAASTAAAKLGPTTRRDALSIVAVISLAHAALGLLIALLFGSALIRVQPAVAFGVCGALAGLVAAGGVAKQAGWQDAARSRMGAADRVAVRGGALAVSALVGVGALTYCLALVLSYSSVLGVLSAAAPGIGSALGMLLLCLGYLPNAVIAALSFAAGPGLSFGAVSLTPLSYNPGALPAVPLLAVLPDHHTAWTPLVFVLPLAAGALVGWYLRAVDESPVRRLRAVALAALCAAVVCLVLAALAGGSLGRPGSPPVLVPAGLLGLTVFGWVLLAGGVVSYVAGPRPAWSRGGAAPLFDLAGDESGDQAADDEPAGEDDVVDDEPAADEADDEGATGEAVMEDDCAELDDPPEGDAPGGEINDGEPTAQDPHDG
ncbi:MAG: cell division protein PerM [Sciscionella sp.]